jgi:hypothetical protein
VATFQKSLDILSKSVERPALPHLRLILLVSGRANEPGGNNVNRYHAEDWAAIRARMEEPVEVDIWRAANLLVHQFGDEAETFVMQWADLMLERDDQEGQLVWSWIRRAVVELRALEVTQH